MQNNNNGAPFGVIRDRQISRPNLGAGAVAGAGGFGGAPAGAGLGAVAGVVPAGAGLGAGGAGVVPAGAGAGGFGAVPTGAGLGAGGAGGVNAPLNNDRPTTPTQQVFPLNNGNYLAIQTPPHQEAIQQPQVAVQHPQVAVRQTADNQAHLVNGINTPPPSPRGI